MICKVCGAIAPDKCSPEANEWDWFTGFLRETVHFCPIHKDSQERDRLFAISQQKPPEEACITIRGEEQVAIVMEALHKAGFIHAMPSNSMTSTRLIFGSK